MTGKRNSRPTAPPADGTAEDALLRELRRTNRLLAKLVVRDLDQRAALGLLSELAFTPTEMGTTLGMTPNAVSVALHRMRKADSTVKTRRSTGDGAAVEVAEDEQG